MNIFDFGFLKGKLSTKLLAGILLVSGTFFIVTTGTQLYFEFEYEKKMVNAKAKEVGLSYQEVLNEQISLSNTQAIQSLLESIVNFDGIARASLKTKLNGVENVEWFAVGSYPTNDMTYGLGLVISTGENNFGNPILLEIVSDYSGAREKLFDKAFIIVSTQAAKAFFVSLFILFFVQQVVVKHIRQIVNWLQAFKPESSFEPLPIQVVRERDNEINVLKSKVSEMGHLVHQHTVHLENQVKQRTIELEQQTEELEKAKSKLEELAYTDSLTNVSNRLDFFNQAEREIHKSRRLSYDLGLMMLDLDHFKEINDNYGHDVGDEVLIAVANSLKHNIREEDIVGRIGGEEFAIVVVGADSVGMQKLAKRIKESIQLLEFPECGDELSVTISMGYTKVDQNESLKSALKRADKHLYDAKSSGRNCFVTDEKFIPSIVS